MNIILKAILLVASMLAFGAFIGAIVFRSPILQLSSYDDMLGSFAVGFDLCAIAYFISLFRKTIKSIDEL